MRRFSALETTAEELDQAVNCGVVTGKRRKLVRGPTRNGEIRARVELVSPQASSPKWLISELLSDVVSNPSGEHKDPRRAPP